MVALGVGKGVQWELAQIKSICSWLLAVPQPPALPHIGFGSRWAFSEELTVSINVPHSWGERDRCRLRGEEGW